MAKDLDQIKATFTEIDKKTQLATKGGDYVTISTQNFGGTMPGGAPYTQVRTYYTYWNGAFEVTQETAQTETMYMPDGTIRTSSFDSHTEDYIMANYNKPQWQIPNPWLPPPPPPITYDPGTPMDPNDVYGPDGYDANGFDRDGFDRNGYDDNGYDAWGYDANGYDYNGYNQQGYDQWGYDGEGFDSSGYNADGYDINGMDSSGLSADGNPLSAYTQTGYDSLGFNEYGYSADGYTYDEYQAAGGYINGYDGNGYNLQGFNSSGINADGFDEWTYNNAGGFINGLSSAGYTEQQYAENGGYINNLSPDGYTPDGYLWVDYLYAAGGYIDGFDVNGYSAAGYTRAEYTSAGGYINGYNADGYDGNGFNAYGISANGLRASAYDANGFDSNGYDAWGFDANGLSAAGVPRQDYAATGYYNGFNVKGYSNGGYTEQQYADNGGYFENLNAMDFTPQGFSANQYFVAPDGYINGFDIGGVSVAGYTTAQYNDGDGYVNGYDPFGYDKDGFDAEGLSIAGYTRADYEANGGYIDGLDPFGNTQEENDDLDDLLNNNGLDDLGDGEEETISEILDTFQTQGADTVYYNYLFSADGKILSKTVNETGGKNTYELATTTPGSTDPTINYRQPLSDDIGQIYLMGNLLDIWGWGNPNIPLPQNTDGQLLAKELVSAIASGSDINNTDENSNSYAAYQDPIPGQMVTAAQNTLVTDTDLVSGYGLNMLVNTQRTLEVDESNADDFDNYEAYIVNQIMTNFVTGTGPENLDFPENGVISSKFIGSDVLNAALADYNNGTLAAGQPKQYSFGLPALLNDYTNNNTLFSITGLTGSAQITITPDNDTGYLNITIFNITSLTSGDLFKNPLTGSPNSIVRNSDPNVVTPYGNVSQTYHLRIPN